MSLPRTCELCGDADFDQDTCDECGRVVCTECQADLDAEADESCVVLCVMCACADRD